MLASYHGHLPLVRLLLRHGADPNTLNDRGQSPLAGAVFKNEEEVIGVLLEGVSSKLSLAFVAAFERLGFCTDDRCLVYQENS